MCRSPGWMLPFAVRAARAYRIRLLTKEMSAGDLSAWLLPPDAPLPALASLFRSLGASVFRDSISESGMPTKVSTASSINCRSLTRLTAQLPHIPSAGRYRNEYGTVQQQFHHDALACLAEEDQQLGPRRPFKGLRMVVLKDGEQTGDGWFVTSKVAMFWDVWSHGFAEAVTKEVLGPSRHALGL